MLRRLLATLFVALGLGAATDAHAQTYPTRPIHLVVPYAAGGPTDLTGRVVGEYLAQRLGQNVIVENRPGAGTAIGIDYVAKSTPDGYTLVWASSDGLSVLPAVRPTVPYKVSSDFAFIATAAKYTGPLLAVHATLPFKSMAELIAYGKANPGALRYSSTGNGSGVHLSTALIAKTAGIEMTHVPYQGAAPAILDASKGVVDMILVGQANLRPFTENNTLRPLAAASEQRNAMYPDVPTLAEVGLPNVNVDLYIGLLAPAGTPADIVGILRRQIAEMAKDATVIERFKRVGAETAYLDSDAFRAYMLKDYERWKDVVDATGIKMAD